MFASIVNSVGIRKKKMRVYYKNVGVFYGIQREMRLSYEQTDPRDGE